MLVIPGIELGAGGLDIMSLYEIDKVFFNELDTFGMRIEVEIPDQYLWCGSQSFDKRINDL